MGLSALPGGLNIRYSLSVRVIVAIGQDQELHLERENKMEVNEWISFEF